MNNNKINVITNELSNEKKYIPIGNVNITPDITVNDLIIMIGRLKEDLKKTNDNLATYKTSVTASLNKIQTNIDNISNAIEKSDTHLNAEIKNIKESIKLLGGVL